MVANAKDGKMTDHVERHATSTATVRVWAPLDRVFHWGLAVAPCDRLADGRRSATGP